MGKVIRNASDTCYDSKGNKVPCVNRGTGKFAADGGAAKPWYKKPMVIGGIIIGAGIAAFAIIHFTKKKK